MQARPAAEEGLLLSEDYRIAHEGLRRRNSTDSDDESDGSDESLSVPKWAIAALLLLLSTVVIGVLVVVTFVDPVTSAPTASPTSYDPTNGVVLSSIVDLTPTYLPSIFWSSVSQAVGILTAVYVGNIVRGDGRRGDSMVFQIETANPTEAYHVLTVLSTTASSTVTATVVQQLQTNNYTGPMPAMVTTVIQSVTDGGGSSASSSDTTTLIAIVAIAAAALLLLAVVLAAALFYIHMYKLREQDTLAHAPTVAPQMQMGTVGVSTISAGNPIHLSIRNM